MAGKTHITGFIVFLGLLLFSCSGEGDAAEKSAEQKKSANKSPLDEKAWTKILKMEFNADSLFHILHPDKTLLDEQFHYTVHECNMDADAKNEIFLEFGSAHRKTSNGYLFLFDFTDGKYALIDQLVFEDLYDNDWKIIPEMKMVIMKFRVYGTCDDGYIRMGYKLMNGKIKDVTHFYGEHEGNSCNTYQEEDDAVKDFEIHSRSIAVMEPVNENTFFLHIRFSEWKADEYMDTNVETLIPETEKKLKYIYNPKLKKFECFNSRGEKLFEDGFMGLSFELVQLVKKGML